MNVFERVIDIVNRTRQNKTPPGCYRVITGALLSMSGDGAEPVYFDDVKGAFSRLHDRRYEGSDFVSTVTRTPSTKAMYYRIVPDRVVERVCEVQEVPHVEG